MLISSTLVFITFAVSTPAWSMRNAAPTSSVTNQPSTPVIIDPGHGGQDLGAVVKGLQEKSIALAVSWKLRDRIKDRIPVVMTREDDTYVTLDDRLVKAVDLNGAVFISIHLNHVRNKKLHGATVFSYGPEKHVARRRRHPKVPPMPAPPKFEATESDVFAGMTVKSMRASGFQVEKAKSDYYVLKNPALPSILIEIGYLSNPEEALKLGDAAYQNKLADAIAQALENYVALRSLHSESITAVSSATPAQL